MVKYELTGRDGSRGVCTGGCFGGLNSRFGKTSSSKVSAKKLVKSAYVDPRLDMSKLLYFSFIPRDSIVPEWGGREKSVESYMNAALDLSKYLKNHSDILRVNLLSKKIDVFIKNSSRDKVMATMFMFRNLCNYSDIAKTYKRVRDLGYNPLFSYLLAEIFDESVTPFSNTTYIKGMFENTLFNNKTFGLNSFLAFLRQDGFDFYGERWVDKPGYSRESDFNASQIYFNGRFGRRFPDVMSIENDEPMPYQVKFMNNKTKIAEEELLLGTTDDSPDDSLDYFYCANIGNRSVTEWAPILEAIANENGIDVRS